jgi:SAM-dependent methyltransferase
MRHQLHHHSANFIHNVGADYRLRLPHYIYTLAILGLLGILTAVLTSGVLSLAALVVGLLLLIPVGLLVGFVVIIQRRRFGLRDRMVNSVSWRGDEHVLDVGTGSGILLFGCAKHLTTGKAVGIDLYLPNAGGGTAETFWRNAHLEGLQDRVDLQNVDARKMPFPDQSFDVIMSSFALHHIGDGEARAQATREMLRVLKPGGTIALCDVAPMISQSVRVMQDSGLDSGMMEVKQWGRVFSVAIGKKK